MTARKSSPKKKAATPAGAVAWTVRGEGPLPEQLTGGAPSATDAELAQLVDSLAYRVLELVPTLTHEEILEAVAGVDADDPLTLFILQKVEGAFGTLTTMDGATWVEGLGPQLVGQLHGGGTYQLRVQARQNGIRRFIKQPMFRVPGRVVVPGAAAPAAGSSSTLELIKELGVIATALAPVIKTFMGERAAPAAQNPATFVQMFREGLELGKTTVKKTDSSDAGGADSYARTLREVIPPALEALRGLAAPSAPATPAPQPPPEIAAAIPAGPPLPYWAGLLTSHVPQLMKLARVRADVGYWAEQVLGMIDAEQLTFIGEQLDRGEAWRAEFFQYFPEAAPHRSWFDRFFDALDAELEPEPDDDNDLELEGRPDEQPQQLRPNRETLPGFDA